MITMQKVLLLVSVFSLVACASTIQSSSLSEAYKKYEDKDYERVLELITRAENVRATIPEMKAELTYLKARTHESLGQHQIANALYEYLAATHKESQYGYLASVKLKRILSEVRVNNS